MANPSSTDPLPMFLGPDRSQGFPTTPETNTTPVGVESATDLPRRVEHGLPPLPVKPAPRHVSLGWHVAILGGRTTLSWTFMAAVVGYLAGLFLVSAGYGTYAFLAWPGLPCVVAAFVLMRGLRILRLMKHGAVTAGVEVELKHSGSRIKSDNWRQPAGWGKAQFRYDGGLYFRRFRLGSEDGRHKVVTLRGTREVNGVWLFDPRRPSNNVLVTSISPTPRPNGRGQWDRGRVRWLHWLVAALSSGLVGIHMLAAGLVILSLLLGG